VLKSASIAYKLFQPDGAPLRAVISATFTDNSDDRTRVAVAQDSSPDVTHVRQVQAGDTLPLLCYRIYGDPRRYVEVAQANGLNDFRRLKAGTRLLFPPVAK
jgi:nucleoid-associated protein YgaU